MKQMLILWITMIFLGVGVYGQDGADRIVGKWLKQPKEDLIIEVYKARKGYHGKVSWTKPGDDKPVGFVIIENLKYNVQSQKWEHGKIRDPKSSRSYSAEVRLDDAGQLIVKGYKGAKFLSSSRTFSRVKR